VLAKSIAGLSWVVILGSPLFPFLALAFIAGFFEVVSRRGDGTVLGGTVLELVQRLCQFFYLLLLRFDLVLFFLKQTLLNSQLLLLL
jgi:hypothetical protein